MLKSIFKIQKPNHNLAIKKADSPDAKFIEHEKVMAWLKSWGTDAESINYLKLFGLR